MMRALLVGLMLVNIACATTTTAPPSGPRARDYVPLAVGNRWEYRVNPAPPEARTEAVSIVEMDSKGFFVDSRGARLAPRSDGVFDGDRFLIQEPLEIGHEWIAVPKGSPDIVERYKIVAVGTQVHVPAGTFNDCIEVEAQQQVTHPSTGEKATLLVRWVYAPGVGMVKMDGSLTPSNAAPIAQPTMELVAYTVKPQG